MFRSFSRLRLFGHQPPFVPVIVSTLAVTPLNQITSHGFRVRIGTTLKYDGHRHAPSYCRRMGILTQKCFLWTVCMLLVSGERTVFCGTLHLLVQRLQKLETARHEALRTLKTSQALTKAETTRKIKIQKAREQLG